MNTLIDTHCHLDLPPLFDDVDRFLDEGRDAGVSHWVVPGVSSQGWDRISGLSGKKGVFAAYGIHPSSVSSVINEDMDRLRLLASVGVAIGETGLDSGCSDMQLQELVFREQIRIAVETGLPLIVHSRGAIGRTIKVMTEEKADRVGGIMHAFSGSLESALACVKLGFMISIAGTVTWAGAIRPAHLAAGLPLSAIVLETDAPDIPPQSRRGKFNKPSCLRETAEKIADIRQVAVEEIISATSRNAINLLGIR